MNKLIERLRPQLRGKLALSTVFIITLLLFFLIFFSIQVNYEAIQENAKTQANAIFNTIHNPYEQFLTKRRQLKNEKDKLTKLAKNTTLKFKMRVRNRKRLKKSISKLEKDVKADFENIQRLYSQSPENYQVTMLDTKFILWSHSHPKFLTVSKIGMKLARPTRNSKRYSIQKKIFKAYSKAKKTYSKKKSDLSFLTKSQSTINRNRGFAGSFKPLFNYPKKSKVAVTLYNYMNAPIATDSKAIFTNSLRKIFQSQKKLKVFMTKLNSNETKGLKTLSFLNNQALLAQAKLDASALEKRSQKRKYFNYYSFKNSKENWKKWKQLKKLQKSQYKLYVQLIKKIKLFYNKLIKNQKLILSNISDANYLEKKNDKKRRKKRKKVKNKKDSYELEDDTILIEQKIIKARKEKRLLISSLKSIKNIHSKLEKKTETPWDKMYSRIYTRLLTPKTLAANIILKNYAGIVEIRVKLGEQIIRSQINRNRLADIGISFLLRTVFLVILMANFFVKDIKRLVKSAALVEKGNLEEKFSVQSKDELSLLARAFNKMIAGLRERESMMLEMKTAAIIQKNLLPSTETIVADKTIDFSFMYRAMTGVGGDYVDLFDCSTTKKCIVVADVSNHGIGPGLVMTMMRSSLRSMSRSDMPLANIVKVLNADLYHDTPPEIFVTSFIGYLYTDTGQFEYISNGHNPPYLLENKKCIELKAGGMALGAMMPAIFDPTITSEKTVIRKDTFLFQYTDGLTEAFNKRGEQLGEERLIQLLENLSDKETLSSDVIVKAVMNFLEKFTGLKLPSDGPTELSDDVAMIALSMK